jgi:hypothetical protein
MLGIHGENDSTSISYCQFTFQLLKFQLILGRHFDEKDLRLFSLSLFYLNLPSSPKQRKEVIVLL